MLLSDKKQYSQMVEPRTAIDEIVNVSQEELTRMSRGEASETFYTAMNAQLDLVQSLLVAGGQLRPADPVDRKSVVKGTGGAFGCRGVVKDLYWSLSCKTD